MSLIKHVTKLFDITVLQEYFWLLKMSLLDDREINIFTDNHLLQIKLILKRELKCEHIGFFS